MNILVCEDNKLTSRTLEAVLTREGYSVDSADDGSKAISLLKENKYNLVIVDIHLPFHSGLELIKFLRSDLKRNTPVLIITAFSEPQFLRQAEELGINGYIVKPFDPADLLKNIRSICKK